MCNVYNGQIGDIDFACFCVYWAFIFPVFLSCLAECVQALLAAGAMPDQVNTDGIFPLLMGTTATQSACRRYWQLEQLPTR